MIGLLKKIVIGAVGICNHAWVSGEDAHENAKPFAFPLLSL